MDFSKLLADLNNFVWGPVMLVMLVGTGIFLTIRLKFLPWRNLGYALRMVVHKRDNHEGDISPFQSLMTALSATIGTGNIVGVSTAMVLGGPGALVWMWISAAFGLSTKYGESVLAVKYRETNSVGEMAGGPMYAMKNGISNKYIGRTLAALVLDVRCPGFFRYRQYDAGQFHCGGTGWQLCDTGLAGRRHHCGIVAGYPAPGHSQHRQGVEHCGSGHGGILFRYRINRHHREFFGGTGWHCRDVPYGVLV
jgi:hypothetical protein